MKRHRILLTICTMLAGAAAALPQEPAPQPAPAPKHTPFPGYAPGHPALLRDGLDEVRAQMDILRSQIDTEVRDSFREQVEVMKDHRFELNEVWANAMAAKGAFSMDPGLAFVP